MGFNSGFKGLNREDIMGVWIHRVECGIVSRAW